MEKASNSMRVVFVHGVSHESKSGSDGKETCTGMLGCVLKLPTVSAKTTTPHSPHMCSSGSKPKAQYLEVIIQGNHKTEDASREGGDVWDVNNNKACGLRQRVLRSSKRLNSLEVVISRRWVSLGVVKGVTEATFEGLLPEGTLLSLRSSRAYVNRLGIISH